MLNFNSYFSLKTAGQDLFSNASGGFPSTLYGYYNVLDRLKGDFLEKSEKYDRFLSCFIQYPELCPDVVYDYDHVESVNSPHNLNNSDGPLVRQMIQSIFQWMWDYGEEQDQDHYVATLTTSDGRVFNIMAAEVFTTGETVLDIVTTLYFGCYYNNNLFSILETSFHGNWPLDDSAGYLYTKLASVMIDVNGNPASFFDVLADIKENGELNELYYQASQYQLDSNQYVSAIQSKVYSSSDCVKQQANLFVSAFTNSGVLGIVNLFKSLFTDLSNVDSSSGLIELTDNNSMMPAEYITGMIAGLITSVGAVASAIISIASPILGMITAAAITIFNKVASFQYDYDNFTTASIFDEGNMLATPFAIFQKTSNDNTLGELVISDCQNINIGWMLLNIGSSNIPCIIDRGFDQAIVSNDGIITNFETHIDLRDRTSAIMDFLRSYTRVESTSSTAPFYYKYYLEYDQASSAFDLLKENFQNNTALNNLENGTLSSDDDFHLRLIIACNLLLSIIRYRNFGSYQGHELGVWLYSYSTPYAGDYYSLYDEVSQTWRNVTTAEWKSNKDRDAGYKLAQLIHALCAYAKGHSYNFDYVLSWANLIQMCNTLQSNDYKAQWANDHYFFDFSHSLTIDVQWYCYSAYTFDAPRKFCICIPKYNRQTFWSHVLAVAVATVTIAATASIVAFKVRSWSMRKATERSAKIEKAWSDYTDNPTAENLKAYRRLVTKNNLCSFFFGGQKYSRSGYWCATGSTSTTSVASNLLTKLRDTQLSEKTSVSSDLTDAIEAAKNEITTLITG